MPGRPPIPTVFKLMRGETRPSRINRNEPKPPPAFLRAPSDLSPEAKKEWRRLGPPLYSIGLLTELDRTGLMVYCETFAWWREACQKLRGEGLIITDDEGVKRKSVWARVESMTFDHLLTLSREFGLTPASRTKIHAVPPKGHDSKAARFFGDREPNPWAKIGHKPTDDDAS